ncbi:hypothetical protein VTH82DRAFT_3356 [Thermothelomyces myriococcoides]
MSNFNHGFSADEQGRGNILTTPVLIFLVLSTIDIGFNAAAGVAAVAAGAHANGSPLTDRAKGIGALAAVTKSGLLAFVGFLGFANLNIAAWMVLLIAGSVFGIAILVTLQVANTVLGETPSELLIAALVAAIPLQWEGVGMYYSLSSYYETDSDGETRPRFSCCGFLTVIGWDALGGYVFARMAQNQDMEICALNAAAAAGAAFGAVALIPKLMAYVSWGAFWCSGRW